MANNILRSIAATKHDAPGPGPIACGDIEAAVFRAVDALNELLADTQQLPKQRDALLLDTGTVLDSMAVINLLVFIEDEVSAAFGREITLAGEESETQLNPESLKTLGTLMDALQTILNEA